MSRLGILGGSFNPVHIGHVRLALEMAEALGLDRVELVPAARPPHKEGCAMLPFDLRAGLLALAVEGVPGLAVNLMEAGRPGPSYTIDTLEELARQRPEAELHFILGACDLLNLHLWHRGFELADVADLAVSNRDRLGREAVADYIAGRPELGWRPEGVGRWRAPSGRRIRVVDVPRLDISASFVRERFRLGANLRFLIPQKVEEELGRLREQVLDIWSMESGQPSCCREE